MKMRPKELFSLTSIKNLNMYNINLKNTSGFLLFKCQEYGHNLNGSEK